MAEFVSNTPVSRPRNTKWTVNWDMGGMLWSNDYGVFFQPVDEMVPLKLPNQPSGRQQ